MALDLHGFYPDTSPNQAMFKIADTITENKRYQEEKKYRREKDKEANQYRNYNIVADNTDLSKSLTGIPAIDKAYTEKMKGVINELLQAAGNVSHTELAGMVNEKATPIFMALNAARSDYQNGQKLITEMTAQSKELDRAKLTNDLTNRAIQNYLDPKTGQAIHPDATHPIDFSIYSDPEYLSDFVSDENLIKGIRKPEGAETTTVLAGKPHDYTEYQTKNTLWTEPAYDQSKFDDKGFYTGGDIPQRKIKSEQITVGGKPMDIVTDDVYNSFSGDRATHAAIIARAKKEFGADNYKKFNVNERAIAEKHALYKYIKENDDTQLHPVKTVAPPVYHSRTTNNINNANKNAPIDLREYPDVEGGGKDITSLLQDINVVSLVTGKSFGANQVIYNPSTKRVRFTDPVNNKEEEMSLTTFLQNLRPQNPAADIKWLREGLFNAITGAAPAKKDEPVKDEKQPFKMKWGSGNKKPQSDPLKLF